MSLECQEITMYRISYWTFRQSFSHTSHVAQLVDHAIALDFLNFSLIVRNGFNADMELRRKELKEGLEGED